jgi:hypothetical protein
MSANVRTLRAEPEFDRIDDEVVALIKGMLARGDRQSDIAACFYINGGRVSEINTGQHHAEVKAAPENSLPPPGPYPSPFELWKAKRELWRGRVALESARESIDEAIASIRKAEQR